MFLQVVDPAAFGDAARYGELVDEALDAAKRQPPADGVAEVLVPGEPEARARRGGAARASRCPPATWAELGKVAARFGVPLPPSGRAPEPGVTRAASGAPGGRRGCPSR